MLCGDSLIARVSPRVQPGMRTSPSCPSYRTTRSRIEAVGFCGDAGVTLSNAGTGAAAGAGYRSGAGAAFYDAGTGAAAGAVVAAGIG